MAKILIADDDPNQADAIADVLKRDFHTIEVVNEGKEALERLKLYHYDLAILDWQMPELAGIDVVHKFRMSGGKTPVLMLTGKSQISDKIEGLDTGADDYLTKPFRADELAAHVRALLRRPEVFVSTTLSLGNLVLTTNNMKVAIDGKELALSPLEMKVMELLLKHPNEVVTQNMLLERVWSSEADATSAAVYTCIKALRKKLQGNENTPALSTVYGVGYRLELKK
jgi:DNA-binding response OmpR family regulator